MVRDTAGDRSAPVLGIFGDEPEQESILARAIAKAAGGPGGGSLSISLSDATWSTPIDVDGAVLFISALAGPMGSTYEVLLRLRVLRIHRLVVALKDASAVDDEEFLELVEMECRDVLDRAGFPGDEVPIVRVSPGMALRGDAEAQQGVLALLDAFDNYDPNPFEVSDDFVSEALEHLSRSPMLREPGSNATRPVLLGTRADTGGWWVPNFQFTDGDGYETIVVEVHGLLEGEDDPEGAFSWWTTPNPWLNDLRPSDLIGHGMDQEIRFAANQTLSGGW